MANKSIKLKEGFQVLPDSIQNLLEQTFPAAPVIDTPTDTDSAILAQGILSKHLLDVFATLEGFSIAAAMMHIGQLNSVNQVMALASVQVRAGINELTVILPSTSIGYVLESMFLAEVAISGDLALLESVTIHRQNPDESSFSGAMLTGQEAVDLELLSEDLIEEGHFYADQILYDAGDYTYTFTATINGEELTSTPLTITAS